ncbi:MAG: undecaprenyl-diphosphate phosphatase [Opitutales bacterium]
MNRSFRPPRPLQAFLAGCLAVAGTLPAQPPAADPEPADRSAPEPIERADALGYGDAVILGAVEGITEYLPVSSTGHLILTNRLLGLDAPAPVLGSDGEPVWLRKPGTAEPADPGRAYTLKEAADAYVIIIQAGAIAAVALLYRRRLLGVANGLLGRNRTGRRLGINLVLAFLPAAVLGLLLDDWISARLFGTGPVLIALVAGAILMLLVEHRRRRRQGIRIARGPLRQIIDLRSASSGEWEDEGPDLHELNTRQCLLIGLLQCVAMWPGTSRSMMTIVGGYLVGLRPRRAAEFSFLLGLITLTAAAGYRVMTDGAHMVRVLTPGPLLAGGVVAFVTAAAAVSWLVSWLTRHGLSLFAWYRIALAGALALLLYT